METSDDPRPFKTNISKFYSRVLKARGAGSKNTRD